ncbi:MAG: hypothetical protein WCK51_02445 [Armatimonadota bacterium]
MMIRLLSIAFIATLIVGCGSGEAEMKTNPPTPPPTEEQLKSMPPQAAKHAKEMEAYGKAMGERQGSQGR